MKTKQLVLIAAAVLALLAVGAGTVSKTGVFYDLNLGATTNVVSDNGTALTFNGVPIGTGGGGSTNQTTVGTNDYFQGGVSANYGVFTNSLTVGGRAVLTNAANWVGDGVTNSTLPGAASVDNLNATNGVRAGASTFTSTTDTTGAITGRKGFEQWQGTLTHAGTTTLDFDAAIRDVSMATTGNVVLATSNLATNRNYQLLIQNVQATNCTITVPADWRVPGGRPSTIAAGRWGLWSLKSYGSTDTNVLASYAEEM